jgi:hypothetical protein
MIPAKQACAWYKPCACLGSGRLQGANIWSKARTRGLAQLFVVEEGNRWIENGEGESTIASSLPNPKN